MNSGCKIIRNFIRPSWELVEEFRGVQVANLDDCMNRIGALPSRIRPMNRVKLLGTAFTVRCPEGDNLMFHKAMDLAQKGDVIVIDAAGSMDRAIFGELMVRYCQSRGVAGLIVNGCIRDSEAISQMDFPVYAIGVTPNGPYKNGPGEINVPICMGNRVISPGDILIGDQDGIVAVHPSEAEALLKEVREVEEKEEAIVRDIYGKGIYPRPWVDEKLAELGCEF